MSDRVLRGARLGGQSFEDERGIEFAPRQQVAYICTKGHAFEIPMAEDAEIPKVWECTHCGAEARLVDDSEPEDKQDKPVRTHWDMLRERRSISELEEILSERLTMLRAGEIGPMHLHRSPRRGSSGGASKGGSKTSGASKGSASKGGAAKKSASGKSASAKGGSGRKA
jgi:RNA polymerase-binding protein